MSAPPCASILLRHAAFGRVVREQDYEEFCTAKCPATFSVYRAFCSGDVLLIRSLPLTHRLSSPGWTVYVGAALRLHSFTTCGLRPRRARAGLREFCTAKCPATFSV